MDMHLTDTHAHLDMERFAADRAEVIQRAQAAGVSAIVTVGIDLASSRAAIVLAHKSKGLFPAVGIHPQETKEITAQDLAALASLAEAPTVVAIGEIGLDYYHDYSPHEKQLEVLRHQLALAAKRGLPALLHCRAAEQDFIPALEQWVASQHPARPGIIHCFSGSLANAQTYLRLGFCLGLGGYIGYPSSRELREVVKQLPMDRLVLETDCPFLPPQGRRGQRNEPAYMVETAETLAQVRGVSVAEVARVTTENAQRVLGI